jgi:hypothetical protein
MPPKKKNRTEGKTSPSKESKAAAKAEAEADIEHSRLESIAADSLIVRDAPETPALKVSELFSRVVLRKDFKIRTAKGQPDQGRAAFDWSTLREELSKRNDKSPTWFMHIRTEELILDPDGLDGEHVECAVIAETTEPTLAPMHMVVRVARPFSDAEDNTPERILKLSEAGLCWREVRGDAGEVLNIFLLQPRKSTEVAPARSFSFGAAPPPATTVSASTAPATSPLPSTAQASADASAASPPKPSTSGFGFGTNSAGAQAAQAATEALSAAAKTAGSAPTAFGQPAVQKSASFGFGAAVPPPPVAGSTETKPVGTTNLAFGFKPPASAPAAPTFAGRPVTTMPAEVPHVGKPGNGTGAPASATANANFARQASTFGAAKTEKIDVDKANFTLWTEKRLKEMKKEIQAGSRIIIEKVKLPPPVSRDAKIQMQNDLHDHVDKTVEQLIRKEFAMLDPETKKVDKWIDDCPVYDEKLMNALQKFRESHVKEAVNDSDESDPRGYQAVAKALRPLLTQELSKRVAERKEMLDKECSEIDEILTLVKKHLLATKDKFRVLKFYPKNDVLRFRPFGKVGGIHEQREFADVCVPAPYVMKNPFELKGSEGRRGHEEAG